MTDLERSHADLRAALILGGRELRKLNFGRRDHLVLVHLRTVLRDAKVLAPATAGRTSPKKAADISA